MHLAVAGRGLGLVAVGHNCAAIYALPYLWGYAGERHPADGVAGLL